MAIHEGRRYNHIDIFILLDIPHICVTISYAFGDID